MAEQRAGDPLGPDDPLEALRDRIQATHDAAARLAEETARRARQAVPSRGWETPASGAQATGELHALIELASAVRSMLPEDIQHQLAELVRQLLVLIRSLLDWWISRLEPGVRGRDAEVEDIPIA
jgi:hypothetical protein